MSRVKMYAMMAAFYGAAMALDSPSNHHRKIVDNAMSEEEKQAKQREIKLRKGLKEFDIDGTKVWALNRNSAIKKLKKKK